MQYKSTENGTLLTYRIKGSTEVQTLEFWGNGHAKTASTFLRDKQLVDVEVQQGTKWVKVPPAGKADMHFLKPIERVLN